MDYREKLQILEVLKKRIEELKKNIMQEQINRGYCPHANVKDYSTFNDLKDNKRKKFCKDCGTSWTEQIRRPEQ